MSSPARPLISSVLALVSAVGSVGADINLLTPSAEARTDRTRTQLTDADFVRMRLLRSNGQIAIAVDLSGKVERVNQSVLSSSWNGTIITAQQQRSIKGVSRFVIPELGNADCSLIRSGDGLILSVIRKDGLRMNEAVVSQTAKGLLFAFKPLPVSKSETGFIDPAKPSACHSDPLPRSCRGVLLHQQLVTSLLEQQPYLIQIFSTSVVLRCL